MLILSFTTPIDLSAQRSYPRSDCLASSRPLDADRTAMPEFVWDNFAGCCVAQLYDLVLGHAFTFG